MPFNSFKCKTPKDNSSKSSNGFDFLQSHLSQGRFIMAPKVNTYDKDKKTLKQQSPKPEIQNSKGIEFQPVSPTSILQRARRNPESLTRNDVLNLQRAVGNQEVGRLFEQKQSGSFAFEGVRTLPSFPQMGQLRMKSNSNRVIQRHNMPMPERLRPEQITGDKQSWTVAGILGSDLAKLKQTLKALIPEDANPSPDERIQALVYTDCPTLDEMARVAGEENRVNAAKVTSTGGIFFNNSHDDYYKADGSPNIDKIRTTIVHESMHAISANHTGIQEYADLLSPTQGQNTIAQLQPDEAITDFLSVQVYAQVFGAAEYITAYWVPASSNVKAATDPAIATIAREQQLPVGWTGDMVDILKTVLGVNEDGLKEMYFKDPKAFGVAITGKREAIQTEWNKKMGELTLTKGVLTAEFQPMLLNEVIKAKMSELNSAGTKEERAQIVITEMQRRNVPAPKKTRFGGGLESLYSVPVIEKAWNGIKSTDTE